MKRSRRVIGAYLSAAVLVLAACGSGDDSSDDDAATNPALTKSEIKLGLIVSQTGNSSSSDKSGAGSAKAWQQWVNANGGIAGHPVKVVVKDDKGDGATATTAAKELLDDPSILSITAQAANTEQQVAAVLSGKDVPVVGATGYQTAIWAKQPNYFPVTSQAFPATVVSQLASAKAVGATKFASVYCAEVAACKEATPLLEPAAKPQGVQYTGSIAISTSAPNYTAECLKMIDQGADFIQIAVAPSAGKKLIADCQAQGYNGYFGVTAGAVNADMMSIPNVKMSGGIQGFPWWTDDAPVVTFRDAMKQYASDADYENPSATAVWASLEVVRKSLAAVGDAPTRADLTAGLHALKDEDLGGLLAQKVTYIPGQGTPINCLWLYKHEDGKFTSAALPGPSGNSISEGTLKSDCLTSPTG
ncbi:ABC transporter substrate-binding protein [Yinghuangia sp. ASG 101]|uniref:ABC transporter substrate-binding protein n=1 Tax=Yinghuangia sp. ASG 101 TaxID=2896848 RepID=UPI001E2F17CA|nr:ABC transporter substrate-binding protein [Yinghuangia sp. ASG 101]UGQ11204.1 ABC transporter substrate-binding protein [Yinghuangia sp. ASG 101]